MIIGACTITLHLHGIHSLKDKRSIVKSLIVHRSSLLMDDLLPYPFLAIVGQQEMKTALVLALVNPHIGGVLLIGPYGVGKTTAVRALNDIMPTVEREERDEEGR